MKRISTLILCIIFCLETLTVCFLASSTGNAATSIIQEDFVHQKGSELVVGVDEKKIWLRGVNFDNNAWWTLQNASTPANHHGKIDYQRLKDMNMNSVRFLLNYKALETDSSYGWSWIDTNISWAKEYGIYLILDMHYAPGEFDYSGTKSALWDSDSKGENYRSSLKALWKKIAQRYKDETIIAGYDILNEPVTNSSLSQWQTLAQELVTDIRSIDSNHLIIVERALGTESDAKSFGFPNYPLVNDNNVMYSFHFYSPQKYTHQNYTGGNYGDGGKYPDENYIEIPPLNDLLWYKGSQVDASIPSGNTGWTYYEGNKFKIEDSLIVAGKPVFVSCANQGTAYFDNFIIKEYNPDGSFSKVVFDSNITSSTGVISSSSWQYWCAQKDVDAGKGTLCGTEGYTDSTSFSISGTVGDANFTGSNFVFPAKLGYSYSISGWIKGVNISSGSICKMRLDFFKSASGRILHKRDKAYLEDEFNRLADFGKVNNVPLYLGEFGVYDWSDPDKGSLVWVKDVIDLAKVNNIHLSYFTYHQDGFGIYTYNGRLPIPEDGNQALIDLLTRSLHCNEYQDTTSPAIVVQPPSLEWTNTDQIINIKCSDAEDPLRLIKQYRVTDSSTKPESGWISLPSFDYNVVLSDNGQQYLHVQAIDCALHETYTCQGPYKIDKQNPLEPVITTLYNTGSCSVTITDGEDTLSGVNKTQVRLSSDVNGEWTDYTESFEINTSGTTVIEARTIDNAGNVSNVASVSVYIQE